jgi:YggT family protein
MFVLANFFIALSRVVDMLLWAMTWMLFIRAIISWVSPDPFNPIVQFLYRVTEPVLAPIRRFLPWGTIDISPLIAFVVIIFLQSFLVSTLRDIGMSLRYRSPSVSFLLENDSTVVRKDVSHV